LIQREEQGGAKMPSVAYEGEEQGRGRPEMSPMLLAEHGKAGWG